MRLIKQFLVVVVVFSVVLSALAQEPALTIQVDAKLVNVLCSVTDRKGKLVPSLTKDDFIIEEDGKRQEILKFSKESELPLTMAMLIDTSPSVKSVLPEEKETATAFVRSILTTKDLAMVIKFDKNPKVVQDFTESTRRLADAINSVSVGMGTSVYDAIILASRDYLSNESGRKAMILISDGDDTTSRHRLQDALFAAHESDSVIYSISNSLESGGLLGRSNGTLNKLSEETGGAVFAIRRNGDFKPIFDQIANELRSQYSIAYRSTNTKKDGKFRAIKVTTKESALTARARKGYYAPSE